MTRTLTIALLFAVLAACQSSSTGEGAPATSPSALAGNWRLSHIAGTAIPLTGQIPTLSIAADGKLSGNTGVNSISGAIDKAKLSDGTFETGPLATTRKAGPPEAMALESRFLQLLDQASVATVKDDRLSLGAAGKTLLTFDRVK